MGGLAKCPNTRGDLMVPFFRNVLAAALVIACAIGVPGRASADSVKWIDIHNRTGTAISGVFFSETRSDAWGIDFLGTDFLRAGDTRRFRVRSSSCVVDMKTRFTNDVEHTLRFNICRAEHLDNMRTHLEVAY